jgi:hypothetical protein
MKCCCWCYWFACGLLASIPLILTSLSSDYADRDLAITMKTGLGCCNAHCLDRPYFYWQAVVVAIMVLLATLYPLRKIGGLKEIEALKG